MFQLQIDFEIDNLQNDRKDLRYELEKLEKRINEINEEFTNEP